MGVERAAQREEKNMHNPGSLKLMGKTWGDGEETKGDTANRSGNENRISRNPGGASWVRRTKNLYYPKNPNKKTTGKGDHQKCGT